MPRLIGVPENHSVEPEHRRDPRGDRDGKSVYGRSDADSDEHDCRRLRRRGTERVDHAELEAERGEEGVFELPAEWVPEYAEAHGVDEEEDEHGEEGVEADEDG